MIKRLFYYILSTFFTISVFIYIVDYYKQSELDVLTKQSLKSSKTAYISIFDTYKVAANKDFQHLMSNKKVLELLKKFKFSNNEEKKILRGYLYRYLQKHYSYLKQTGVRQFHFHTHKGESLLRFHNPPKSGDSLMELRTSIKVANIKFKESYGFEGGRIFPGFRYLFPIVYEGQHLGSVEFSLAFEAIENKLKSVLPAHAYILLMNEETTLKKVFDVYKKYFIKSDLDDDYLIENQKISKITKHTKDDPLLEKINKKLKENKSFHQTLKEEKDFSIPLKIGNDAYIINFLALYNIDENFSAYIISYIESKDIISIYNKYTIFTFIGTIVILILLSLIVFAFNERRNTIIQKRKVEENHKNLQMIMDKQKSIIIIYENSKITQVNKQFFETFGVKNIKDFDTSYESISDTFISSKNEKLLNQKKFDNAFEENQIDKINNQTIKVYNYSTKKDEYYLLNIDLYHEKGNIIVLTNISELIELQNMLNTQSKIAAVGEMIGNIAHQWRQPLSAITASATGLRIQVEFFNSIDNETIIETADKINFHAQYLSKTIDDFRDFFKEDTKTDKSINLKDLISKVNHLTTDLLKSSHIKTVYDIDDIHIKHNENIFLQSLLNIINNAKDAMNSKKIDANNRYILINLKEDNNDAILTIQDSGGGIEENILDKIFEPYFTTKHQSIGTGIGLYMTHKIITKQLNGEISVTNKTFEYEGKQLKGACFKIKIPLD